MSNILTIAYTTEGTTDQRFLSSIILKVFEGIAFDCEGDIEVFDPVHIKFPKKNSFIEDLVDVSAEAYNTGINVLCVHVDADSNNDEAVRENKINPAFLAISKQPEGASCKNLVALIPIHMTEAWMLADKELLKEEIGTDLSNIDLGINRHPEAIANPKKVIEDALNIAQAHLTKRRNKLYIKDLYQAIGQKVNTDKLESLQSFKSFKLSVRNALVQLNYLK